MAKNTHIIEVKTTGATKSKQQINGISTGLKSMAKQAALAAGAYFGARALLGAVQSSIDLFGKQELAEKKLETALGRTSQALLNQAKALQQVTMFGDEAIIEAQALIGAFVDDEEAVAAATKATLDLAAAKGFDLVAAADLVSKTLGSSTNALSRYGIEVVGAVGSTERLESLTGNLARVFGGQATEQANTMTGAIAQMNNALGDAGEVMGEVLAPIVTNLAKFFKVTSERVGEFMRGFTETPLERTIREMKDMGLETKDLELTLNALAISKATDNIAEGFENQRNVANKINVALNWKSRLLKEEATIMQDITAITNDEVSIQSHINQLISEGTDFEKINAAQRLANQLKENEERQAEAERRIAFGEEQLANQTELNRLEAERKKLTGDDTIEEETKNLKDQTGAVEDLDAIWAKFIATRKAQFKLEQNARVAGKQALSDLQEMGKEFSAFRKLAQTTAIAQTLYDTYEGAQAAYLSFSKSPQAEFQPILYQALGIAAATAAVGAGLAKVSAIRKAQYGADFVTDSPQMMMVGEGGLREHVQVTPLEGPNLEGPQSQGIVLNISGNVLHESFIEDNVIPQIREGLRLGENMGV